MQKLSFFFILFSVLNFAQVPSKPTSGEIYENIKRLNFLGSVLYVAAHPDDENTNLITYLDNHLHARTAYISLTRGDGGQNLIGSELRELLGVIRTEELLEARKIDGGEQFFSRANDFGFSKHPDETFKIWDKNQVLSDLVYVIRKFRPDIIINRFDHRTAGTTHGHHTASAILSVEAFDVANNSQKFPEHLKNFDVWQPKKLFFNQSWFFYGSQEKFDAADKNNLFAMDIGTFYPTLGKSNSEISALSRSRHSSQGFGTMGSRGSSTEYLEIVKGNLPKNNLFEGIDTTWNRVKNGKKIGEILEKVEQNFDFKNPSASVPELLKAYQLIQVLDDKYWKNLKSEEIKNIISDCSGIFVEAIANTPNATNGENLKINLEAINRSPISVELKNIKINENTFQINSELEFNKGFKTEKEIQISENVPLSSPYWVKEKGTVGMYHFSDQDLTGFPETPSAYEVQFDLDFGGQIIHIKKPLVFKKNDPAKGEVYQPFSVVPKASVNVEEKVMIFGNGTSKKVLVKVKSFTENLNGNLSLDAPSNWSVSPKSLEINLNSKNEEKTFAFEVTPPKNESEGKLIPQLKIGNEIFENQLVELNYDHIPQQKVLLPGAAKIAKLEINKKGEKIGYIDGAGDSVAENLAQIGYQVEKISPQNITMENLQKFDVVVLGIRAFNVIPELKFKNKILFEYVEKGGNLVVQYNTSRGLVTEEIAPFQLELGRDRVTDETSEVRFLKENEVLKTPNLITKKDFENWVQERGLYFPEKWGKELSPVISMNDEGEKPLDGSILVGKYGKGYYVYTGLSFFRELPEGISGAYRLFANLLSLGKK